MTAIDALATTYTRALRWYPAAWRAANADAVVGTLLERAAAEGRDKPHRSELLDLALSGIRTRLARIPDALPIAVRDRVSSVGLAIGAMFSLVLIFQLEYRRLPFGLLTNWGPHTATFGPFASPMIVVYAFWVVAFAVAMVGLTRTARWMVGLTVPLSVAVRIFADSQQMWLRPSATTMAVFGLLAATVLIGRPAGDGRAAGWTAIAGAASLTVFVTSAALRPGLLGLRDPVLLTAWPEKNVIAWIPVAAIVLAIVLRAARQSNWCVAALLLAIPWSAVQLFDASHGRDSGTLLVAAVTVALGIGMIVLVLRLLGLQVRVTRR